ncbi:hypothetical protein T10_11614 [Trichinella papuae]|uniref:Uncharacterized protein n=1 Tax=Trichinella papuae TaxID=268474 RepID=A0A0V1N552_9BILA|nr:hypothetical protein T10_11614 [Trichinella papuae]
MNKHFFQSEDEEDEVIVWPTQLLTSRWLLTGFVSLLLVTASVGFNRLHSRFNRRFNKYLTINRICSKNIFIECSILDTSTYFLSSVTHRIR